MGTVVAIILLAAIFAGIAEDIRQRIVRLEVEDNYRRFMEWAEKESE